VNNLVTLIGEVLKFWCYSRILYRTPMYNYSGQHDIRRQIIIKIVTKLPELL